MKKNESNNEVILEATEECKEANDVEKREEETSLMSNMAEKLIYKSLRDCMWLSNKNEVKK